MNVSGNRASEAEKYYHFDSLLRPDLLGYSLFLLKK